MFSAVCPSFDLLELLLMASLQMIAIYEEKLKFLGRLIISLTVLSTALGSQLIRNPKFPVVPLRVATGIFCGEKVRQKSATC